MSRADIQYMPLITNPARRGPDPASELMQANIWLSGSLHESRERCQRAERLNLAQAVMLAVTAVILVLTWAGYI